MEAEYKPTIPTEPPIEAASTPSVTPEVTTTTSVPNTPTLPMPPADDDHDATLAAIDTSLSAAKAGKAATPDTNHLLPAHTHRRNHIAVIIVAIVLALILAAAAIMTYLRTDDTVDKVVDNRKSVITNTTEMDEPATSEDITKTTDDIDTLLKDADDTADFSATDLSDTSLSL